MGRGHLPATLSPVDGLQLFSDGIRETASTTVTPDGEADVCLLMPTRFGMGFTTEDPPEGVPLERAGPFMAGVLEWPTTNDQLTHALAQSCC